MALPKKKRKSVWCPGGGEQISCHYSSKVKTKHRKRVRCPICNKRLLPRVWDCETWNGKYGNHNFANKGRCIHFILPPHKMEE